jgi:hypothetical protein
LIKAINMIAQRSGWPDGEEKLIILSGQECRSRMPHARAKLSRAA